MTPEQFEQAKQKMLKVLFPLEEKFSLKSVYNQIQMAKREEANFYLNALLEQHKEMMLREELIKYERCKYNKCFDDALFVIDGYLKNEKKS